MAAAAGLASRWPAPSATPPSFPPCCAGTDARNVNLSLRSSRRGLRRTRDARPARRVDGMSAPRPVGPESFAKLAYCLDRGEAPDPRADSLFESLFKAQAELFELVLGGAGLDDLLLRLATALDRVAAPARCSVSLFKAGHLTHHAAPHLGAEL